MIVQSTVCIWSNAKKEKFHSKRKETFFEVNRHRGSTELLAKHIDIGAVIAVLEYEGVPPSSLVSERTAAQLRLNLLQLHAKQIICT